MTAKLTRFRVSGFRSIKTADLEIGSTNILIGPNGAGKSNLLWALEMVRMMAFESLQLFVSERGGATYLMHYRPSQTPTIDITLEFLTDGGENAYEVCFGYASDESLIFLSEKAGFRKSSTLPWEWLSLGAGHRESKLRSVIEASSHATARTVRYLLTQLNFYHFHDTSRRSPLRTRTFNDSADRFLRSDGSNLSAYLLSLCEGPDESNKPAWLRIQKIVQRIAPFIRELSPTPRQLDWKDERGASFGPAHLSDGTLRAIALVTALAQPSSKVPLVSCIDEPELGLHPSAVAILCSLISSLTTQKQVIVSTQSPAILDAFEPNDIIVVERQDASTQFRRLEKAKLASWLDEFTLSDLYEKNVFGGRP